MLIFTVRRVINSLFVLLVSSFIVYMFAASQYDPLAKFRPLASTSVRPASSTTRRTCSASTGRSSADTGTG